MKILFVCLGNICRSPAAESVMNKFISEHGLSDRVTCDSAGTAAYHEGERADPRMRAALSEKGYPEPSRSRPVLKQDFLSFDLILAMDRSNYQNLIEQCSDPNLHRKIQLFCTLGKQSAYENVPDPYYGGKEGFYEVIALVESVCADFVLEIGDTIASK